MLLLVSLPRIGLTMASQESSLLPANIVPRLHDVLHVEDHSSKDVLFWGLGFWV